MASAFLNLLRAMWIAAKIIGGIGAFLLLLNFLQHPPEQVLAAFAARWLFLLSSFGILTAIWWLVLQLNPKPRS